MTHIVCPSCHSLTPPYRNCMACHAFLGELLDANLDGRPDAIPTPRKESWLSIMLGDVWRRFFVPTGREAAVQMDPRLRRNCRRVDREDTLTLKTSSATEDEIAAVARVTDLARFKALDQVKRVITIAEPTGNERDAIVTARISGRESDVEQLRRSDCVLSLKAAARVRPFLEQTVREGLSCNKSSSGAHGRRGGEGVIVGIIDFGLDFTHRNFRLRNGRTRVLALWDQKYSDDARRPEKFGYGRLFERDAIDRALEEADPFKALGYSIPKDSLFETGAHGTYVTDVAAGNGNGSGCAGLAPEADIVFVDVSAGGPPILASQEVGGTFGDSVQVLEAIRFIFDYAGDRPCVINLSIGTYGGPHDGSSPVEQAIDRLVCEKPNRAVVVSAGNSFGGSLHAMGRVTGREDVDLKWRIPRFDETGNELEIWYSNEDQFTVELIDPDGRRAARVKPGHTFERVVGGGLITVVNRLNDPNGRDNSINLFFERRVPSGTWSVRLKGERVRDGRFHAWIERDELGQSRFVKPKDKSYAVTDEYTLSSVACGRRSIVVGSYNAYEPDLPLSDFSSSGPVRGRTDHPQPTICAPGDNVLAAQSGTMVLRHRQSGTSLSAAAVTGAVALMLSEADGDLTADQIKRIIIGSAHKDRSMSGDWDPPFGYGRLCASEAVGIIQAEGVDRERPLLARSSGQS